MPSKQISKKKEQEFNQIEKFLNKKISRRDFIKYSVMGIGGLALGGYGLKHLFGRRPGSMSTIFKGAAPDSLWKWSREGSHYIKLGRNVQCQVCPHMCSLEPGDRSICRNKVNMDGKLYTLAYGNPNSVHVDPIEKKPLYHFLPQTGTFSISTAGCNLRCLNCQNWTISQFTPEETKNVDLMPQAVVDAAIANKCNSIAYTYGEPVSYYEYMYDTQKLARKSGLKNLWITAGYINEKPLRDLAGNMDAANIDLKGFSEEIYNELNQAKLKPVLNTLKICKEEKIWVEITNLVVPSWTDDMGKLKEMTDWLYKNGLEDYPIHFSRFHPMYKLTHLPATPVNALKKAKEIALDSGMKFVYIGNVPELSEQNTICPKCGDAVIKRKGYVVTENNLQNGTCKKCGEKIPGVWSL